MGWPFNKKTSLRASGIFEGFTDWHSHILPGVDDGLQSIEDSLEVLKEYESLGFSNVWLTPHIMEEYPNETAKLRERFEELKQQWTGKVKLHLAAENMLDTLFQERLGNNDFLPIGENSDHLLIETSYYTPPYGMEEMMDMAKRRGYNLILAHPERYRYMEEKDYKKLKEEGVKFQMNIFSLGGAYGDTAKKKAEWLLANNMIEFLGTDIHQLGAAKHNSEETGISKKHIEKLLDVKNQLLY